MTKKLNMARLSDNDVELLITSMSDPAALLRSLRDERDRRMALRTCTSLGDACRHADQDLLRGRDGE